MGWGLWVHADDVAKEGVPALLNEVADVGKGCTMTDISVFDFMEPTHTEDTSTSLTAHVDACRWFKSAFKWFKVMN